MPELPEVETIRRQLRPIYQDEVIEAVQLNHHAGTLLQNCPPDVFREALPGNRIAELQRVGKYLIFDCREVFPVFHLGMSGIFLQKRQESSYQQHIHVELLFESGKTLFFQDMRRFGKIWLYPEYPRFPKLGVDPVNGQLTQERFRQLLKGRNVTLKLLLMDQARIAGIGNIYASEILFRARISPFRKTGELSSPEISALYEAIGTVLNSAIDKFGTTYSVYRTLTGQRGENQHFLQVYQRTGQPCYKCGQPVQKVILGSRSTFFCARCQR